MIFVELCEECGEEFCSGTCLIFQYDSYQVQSIRHVFVEVIDECGETVVGHVSYSSTIHIRYRAYAMIFVEVIEECGEEFWDLSHIPVRFISGTKRTP
jgi:hypothetical protein